MVESSFARDIKMSAQKSKWEVPWWMHFASRSRKSAADRHELQRRETVGRGHVRKSMTERRRKEAEPLNDLANEKETRIRRRCWSSCYGLRICDGGTREGIYSLVSIVTLVTIVVLPVQSNIYAKRLNGQRILSLNERKLEIRLWWKYARNAKHSDCFNRIIRIIFSICIILRWHYQHAEKREREKYATQLDTFRSCKRDIINRVILIFLISRIIFLIYLHNSFLNCKLAKILHPSRL